ncbi:hypothetical protein PQX77_016051 [Marasmius sp. AFHP31]|nr:hypothetical protein PQX77_016051 [Marasmius sp. AFHP31]
MSYTILVSHSLDRNHPHFLPQLKALLTPNDIDELDMTVCVADPAPPGIKSILWQDDSNLLGALWFEAGELAAHIAQNSLVDYIQTFRADTNDVETSEDPLTLLIVHGMQDLSEADRALITVEMCRQEVQCRCLYRDVESVVEAASFVYTYMHALLKAIAHPTPHEVLKMFRAMLLVIPGMTNQRVDLVTRRYGTFQALSRALERIERDVEAGRVTLNEDLFFESPSGSVEEDLWVRNLFLTFRAQDPDTVLIAAEDS